MMMIQRFFALVALLTLAACGGGGGASGTSTFGGGSGSGSGAGGGTGTGGGGTTTTAGLTLSISNATITPTTPATITVNLRDNEGKPLSGRVISISTARAGLASLSASSVLTGTDGTAQVTLRAGATGTVGADDVTAVANVGTTTTPATVTASIGFNVAGAAATIATTITSTTLKASTGAATLTATVRDERGAALPNQVVLFSASTTTVTLGAASALSDAQGRASTTVAAANASTSAAVTVLASTTVNGNDLQSGVNLQVVAEQPSMTLTLSSSAINTTTPATVRALLRDVAGNPIANAVVSFTSQFALGNFDNANGVTDANGTAQTVLSPKTATTTGSDVVTASATVAGAIATARATVQFAASSSSGVPVLQLALSTTSISAAAPATVTATLTDSRGSAVPGQVVTFTVVRGLARTNIGTSLTDTSGRAVVVLSPTAATSAGADEITASASVGGAALQATRGFQVQATAVTLDSLLADSSPLSAYGQTTLTLRLTGASVTSPVNITLSSSCVAQGKATLSPSTLSATSSVVTMQYRDAGCGAVQVSDQLQAVVTATGTSRTLTLPIDAPGGSSIAFVQASPEQIFLRGSGFTESSLVTFEARDAAGNALPAQDIELRLQTGAGGVLMEGRGVESVNPPSANPVVLRTNALGRVSARVNSGTLPTPVRVHARFRAQPNISTVSSNLSVAVGLPSQLNFSLSQGTKNIEGFNIDGTPNTYQIIAADRNGNPVPVGTSINFVAEGGQVEAIKQTQLVNGIARTVANYVSSSPKPVDGRITVVAYALGEESFIDLNGNNTYDPTEPFQDLGNIFKDRNFDGFFDARDEEFISLEINNAAACAAPNSDLLGLNASIPSMPSSCDGRWSGAGQVYVRRAAETVLSTSAARPLWADTARLSSVDPAGAACRTMRLQWGPQPQDTFVQAYVSGQDVWYGGATGVLTFFVTDANPGREKPFAQWSGRTPGGAVFFDPLVDYERFPRFNPMAAGTVISATSLSVGLSVLVAGGSPVADTLEPTIGGIGFTFTDPAVQSGSVAISFRSPSGLSTTYQVTILRSQTPPSTCTLPP